MPSKFRLLGLSGSLRRGSYSTAVLETLSAAVTARADTTVFDIGTLPHYDQDRDGAVPPETVVELRRRITEVDGLVVVSPEFNYGIPGVLKNAIDWASRPAFASPLKGKPVLIVTCSPAFTGGVRAQSQLRETFAATLSRQVASPEVVIGQVRDKIVDGRLIDRAALNFSLGAYEALFADIAAIRAAS
ncbi:NADPH-dependent oxidoreductase [Siculibacillus lacustris]|uniref:NADPH-dependent oxidoreductase n=1 Tax=Siculibacillus lacustris TaxID=1549641 RepID=A0A4Q9VXP9_9HYPH|nr:NAD(P)H-dependent oxidoreductase [Siculibacillus lacustris]TBW41276.1 NADPH-dependent oxidoreductase [Siculibacillus lacustris]